MLVPKMISSMFQERKYQEHWRISFFFFFPFIFSIANFVIECFLNIKFYTLFTNLKCIRSIQESSWFLKLCISEIAHITMLNDIEILKILIVDWNLVFNIMQYNFYEIRYLFVLEFNFCNLLVKQIFVHTYKPLHNWI